jgi:hypothetical protein
VKERPILFSGPMVHAILDGRKTQTRRAIKPQPDHWCIMVGRTLRGGELHIPTYNTEYPERIIPCPYGQPGDRLWVRETWFESNGAVHHKAGYSQVDLDGKSDFPCTVKWRPSIHMPRWASRITLEIVEVRVQRVQEISLSDIREEGIEKGLLDVSYDMKQNFITLWDSINAKRGFGWDKNPWVWAIEFKRIPETGAR